MAKFDSKLGDVFYVELGNKKRYFQYVAIDQTQLNSDVIRVFKTSYSIDLSPELSEIVSDEVEFYAHCVIKLGIKMRLWNRVGNNLNVGEIKNVMFRTAADYARKEGEEPIKFSNNWYAWKINDKEFTYVGKLDDKYKKAFVGLVINPNGIIELLKGNKYPANYPE